MIQLPDIIGQDSAVAMLQRAMASGRVPHAFMFAGQPGVGRRTTATALAAALLCENPQKQTNGESNSALDEDFQMTTACGQCEDCRMMAAESHPDFQLIYKELARFHDDASVRNRVMQELGIKVIQKFLIDVAMRGPVRKRGKVFIVREAELMSIAAQNALLKTLEAPPKGVTIILLARQSDQMLPTTQSRCAMVRFGLLPRRFVTEKLAAENCDEIEAEFWAEFTGGSVGRSLQLADTGLYEIKQDVIEKISMLSPAGDAALGESLAKTTDKLATTMVSEAKKKDGSDLSKQLATRRTTGTILEIIASAFQDAISLSCGGSRRLVNADQRPAVTRIAERFAPEQLAEVVEQLSEFERLLWRNVSAKTVWDNVVISCSSAAPLRL